MKITKNDFIDCLREITKDKMVAVKEAKDMFEKRVRKLITAQEYILRSQENQAIVASQEVFKSKAKGLENQFESEAKIIKKQYLSLQ